MPTRRQNTMLKTWDTWIIQNPIKDAMKNTINWAYSITWDSAATLKHHTISQKQWQIHTFMYTMEQILVPGFAQV